MKVKFHLSLVASSNIYHDKKDFSVKNVIEQSISSTFKE